MPKTKLQSLFFSIIMVFFMVLCMTIYTISLEMEGLQFSTFSIAICEMWIEYFIVFILITTFVTKQAMKMASRLFKDENNPIWMILSIQCFTVCLIVPPITLFATLLHQGIGSAWFTQWIQLACLCFPAALILQVFFIGPLVRKFCHLCFQKA